MEFRWIAALTLWTMLAGPVFAPPIKATSFSSLSQIDQR
jgi:hypothetical protein